jgi:hypothetical protein
MIRQKGGSSMYRAEHGRTELRDHEQRDKGEHNQG